MPTRISYLNSKTTYWQDIDLKNIERDFFTEGIADSQNDASSPSSVGSDLLVRAQDVPDATVLVQKGVSYFFATRSADTDGDGTSDTLMLRFELLEDETISLPANTSGAEKTYEVCCSIPAENMDAETIDAVASNIGSIIVQESGAGLENKLLLATITVSDGFTQVEPSDITDHRARVAIKALPKGMTASIAEINLALDGILASSTDLNILENTTVTKAGFNTALTGIESTAAELNLLHDIGGLQKSDLEKLAAINTSAANIDQALDGISPEVSAANLSILTGGGFTNLHKHEADPTQSGVTESPAYFYLPSGQADAVAEKGIMTRFSYEEETQERGQQQLEAVRDQFLEYEPFFAEITNCEGDAGETYTGGSFHTALYKEGAQSRQRSLSLDSTGTLLIAFAGKDLSAFAGSDTIEFWLHVSDLAHADMATLQLGSTNPDTDYFAVDFFGQLSASGWNHIAIPVSSFTATGSPSWADITRVRLEFSTNISGSCDFCIDSLRAIKTQNTLNAIWEIEAGVWELHTIDAKRRLVKTNNTQGRCIRSLAEQSGNYQNGILTARLRRLQGLGGKLGLIWRLQSSGAHYQAFFTGADLKIAHVDGTETELATTAFSLSNGTDIWLRVQHLESDIVVSISPDGVIFTPAVTVNDTSISESGQIALLEEGGVSAFDEVVFEQFSETSERNALGNLARIEENSGAGDRFDGFGSLFQKLLTFAETYDVGETDTEHFKTGTQGWKITESGSMLTFSDLTLRLNVFEDGINSPVTDHISGWIYLDGALPNTLHISLIDEVGTHYATIGIPSADLSLGWNWLSIPKANFTVFGDFDWITVQQIELWYQHTDNTPSITFDELQLRKSTGVLESRFDSYGGQWDIEHDLAESNAYLLQSDEEVGENMLILRSINESNRYTHFNLRGSFMLRRGEGFGLVCKYQDADNFLRLEYDQGRIAFIKRIAGTDTIVGEHISIAIDSDVFIGLKIVCNANVFQTFISLDEGIWTHLATVNVGDFTDGLVGLWSGASLLRIDDFFVYEHNQGGDTFYDIFYDNTGNVSSIIKKPLPISS